jgi:xanthine dehydrogenase accessory factor
MGSRMQPTQRTTTMKDINLWKFLDDELQQRHPVALIVVVDYEKGSPGKTAFKLAFNAEKKCVGTIGGGIMEYALIEQYSKQLAEGISIRELRTLVHSPQTNRGEPSGLSCAGSQTIFALSLNESDSATVHTLYHAWSEQLPAKMILTNRGLGCADEKNAEHFRFQKDLPDKWKYEENMGLEYSVYIVGGGHVGFAISRVMATLDFTVVVYDDRADLPLLTENTYVHKKIVAPYSELGAHIPEPSKTFAAVVTSHFDHDAEAIKQLLPLHLPYLGVMGVPAKMGRIENLLTEEERKEFRGSNIHAPIGIAIDSNTPEEIAVSIAAEMIRVKAELSKRKC